jgi:predicted dienelactone hydrolase
MISTLTRSLVPSLLLLAAVAAPSLAQTTAGGGTAAGTVVTTLDLERRGPYRVQTEDRAWVDRQRARPVPVRVHAPVPTPGTGERFPVIVFSHGLGGSPDNYRYVGRHLASHGFLVLLPTHVGSDAAVAQQGKLALALAAADSQNRIDRAADVSFVLDKSARRKKKLDPLFVFANLSKVGAAGHSFGAWTALAVAGQTIRHERRVLCFRDVRVDCALAMSPQGPGVLGLTPSSWDGITIPAHTMTGTLDTGFGTPDVADRRVAFDSMPPGDKHHLTIEDADHHAFAQGVPGTVQDPRHHGWINAAATGFFRAHLQGDAGAKDWLIRKQLQRDTLGEAVQEQR